MLKMRTKWMAGIVGLVSLSFLASCDNEVDLTANYKEKMLVYCLLDAKQDSHYVRINKVFLGDGNAFAFAKELDSINYDSLEVVLYKFNSGSSTVLDSMIFDRVVNEVPKDSGTFAYADNILYKYIGTIDKTKDYRLKVTNPATGYSVNARIKLSHTVVMAYPQNNTTTLNFEQITPIETNPKTTISWLPSPNTAVYQLVMTFRYREFPIGDPGNFVMKTIVRNFSPIEHTNQIQVDNQASQAISKNEFFGFITNNIPVDPTKARKFDSIDLEVIIGGSELWQYILINQPSSSIVQKVTAYTNISNGLGLFSSRSSGGVYGLNLNTKTQDSLKFGQFTSGLNFTD